MCVWCGEYFNTRPAETKTVSEKWATAIVCVDIFNLAALTGAKAWFSHWNEKCERRERPQILGNGISHRLTLIQSQTPWALERHTHSHRCNSRCGQRQVVYMEHVVTKPFALDHSAPRLQRSTPWTRSLFAAQFLPYTIRGAGNFWLKSQRERSRFIKATESSALWFTASFIAKFDLVLVLLVWINFWLLLNVQHDPLT